MKATETLLNRVLEGQKQFRVPLFQRVYRWRTKNWKKLWADLDETIQAGPAETHFIGSVVSKTLPGTAEGAAPFLLIDGQQRLTTLTLLLAALRDHVRPADLITSEKLHNLYLTNAYETGDAHYKVLPTQADRPAYLAVIDGRDFHRFDDSPIVHAYRYFRERLAATDADGRTPDPAAVERGVLQQLELVSVTLDVDDNEYRIFASLNGTGEPLSQADLIRNHLFMQLPADYQEVAYHDLWFPVQQALGHRLAEFFRDVLQAEGHFVREDNTHREWTERLARRDGADGVLDELREIEADARRWHRLLDPETEQDPIVRWRLHRLNAWRGRTLYPFLLNVLRARDRGEATSEDVAGVLELCEGFMVRRFFCGIPTNQLNRLFLRLWQQLPEELPLVDATRAALSEPGRRWPSDAAFASAIESFSFYDSGKPAQRRLVLETLIEHAGHKEPVDLSGLTIEHIMPQTLSSAWREALGRNAQGLHRQYLHRLGNITLTGYNAELSNAPFDQKRVKLAESNLDTNRAIASHATWGPSEVSKRGRELAKQAVDIWPGPAPV